MPISTFYLIKMGNYVQQQNNQDAPKVPCIGLVEPPKLLDPNKKYIKLSELKIAFSTYSTNGSLNLDEFNKAIFYLLKFDIPQLPFTYLSEKLFYLLDKV